MDYRIIFVVILPKTCMQLDEQTRDWEAWWMGIDIIIFSSVQVKTDRRTESKWIQNNQNNIDRWFWSKSKSTLGFASTNARLTSHGMYSKRLSRDWDPFTRFGPCRKFMNSSASQVSRVIVWPSSLRLDMCLVRPLDLCKSKNEIEAGGRSSFCVRVLSLSIRSAGLKIDLLLFLFLNGRT